MPRVNDLEQVRVLKLRQRDRVSGVQCREMRRIQGQEVGAIQRESDHGGDCRRPICNLFEYMSQNKRVIRPTLCSAIPFA
eukprot:6214267-Pleurochrysis_carterae.AAC.4